MKNTSDYIALLRAYRKLLKIRYTHKDYLVFVAFSGIGDICYCFSFLEALKRKQNKKVLVITRQYTAELLNYYECIDKVIVLEENLAKDFSVLMKKHENEPVYNERSHKRGVYFCTPLSEDIYRVLTKKADNYIDILAEIILDKKADDLLYYPIVPEADISRFDSGGFKTVAVINPYSNSLIIDKNELFNEIVNALNNKGYTVYTNITGSQKPLDGTKALECSLQEMYHITKNAGVFISVRSGILDFSIGNGGTFIVLYNDNKSLWFRKAYSLEGWKTKSKIFEFDCREEEAIIEKTNELASPENFV